MHHEIQKNPLSLTPPSKNNLPCFPGQHHDEETGLDYSYFRRYNSRISLSSQYLHNC